MRRLFYLMLVVGLMATGCNKAERLSVLAGPITQEAVEGNARWNSAYGPFFDAKREGPVIPGLRQGLVPQGLEYLPAKDWLLVSGYRDDGSSLVTIIHAATGDLVKSVSFVNRSGSVYRGHAGGVAVSAQHLWISSGEQVHYVKLDKVIDADNGAEILFDGHLPVDARGSFVSVTDGILWVGDFAREASHPTAEHHHMRNRQGGQHRGWVAGYVLDPVTDLIPTSRPKNQNGAYIPDYALSIRDKIQGVSLVGDYILLTESYGRNNVSHLFVYKNPLSEPHHTTATVNSVEVPVWFLDNHTLVKTWVLPPMVESVALRFDEIYISFESAALKYLDGSYALSRLQIVDADVLLELP